MTIASALAAVGELVRRADPASSVGAPGAPARGLCLWPWRFLPVPPAMNAPPRVGRAPQVVPLAFDLHLIVLPRPPEDLAALDRTLALIAATPVLRAADGTVRLTLGTGLDPADLAALFASVGLPVSPCIELLARMTPD